MINNILSQKQINLLQEKYYKHFSTRGILTYRWPSGQIAGPLAFENWPMMIVISCQ